MNPRHAALLERAFTNQFNLNMKLDPAWAMAGFRYYRAIWTEASEAMCHLNWIWWKSGQYNKDLSPDQLTEVQIELCDILHFGLSLDIVRSTYGGPTRQEFVEQYCHAFQDAKTTTGPIDEYLEYLVVDAIQRRAFNVKHFAAACRAAELDLPGILTFYFAKTVLNEFRWANGYQDKTYIKMWKFGGEKAVEDNTVLGRIVNSLVRNNTPEDLVIGLEEGQVQLELHARLAKAYSMIDK